MDLSLVVCAYDMARELPRTIQTLSPHHQRDMGDLSYEIVVLDNGSPEPVNAAALQAIAPNLRVVRIENAAASPAAALNAAVADTTGRLVGLFIDGARMVSPGMLALAIQAHQADPNRVIGSLGFHLGPDVQMRSVLNGYTRQVEDDLLAEIPWQRDGYTLFQKSVLAGSSSQGWFGPIEESNGLFLDRALWQKLGGFDERYASPGGGLVNLEFWQRAVDLSGGQPWILLGEGTFHQIHGGAATNGTQDDRIAMAAEHRRIFGKPLARVSYTPRYIGSLSAELARRFTPEPMGPPRQAHMVFGRPFKVALPSDALSAIQAGTLRTRYRGRRLAKNPFDLVLYLQLLERLRPRTIIEVGTSEGGSALWLRDQCRTLGIDCRILTMDITPPEDPIDGVEIFSVDASDPVRTFPHAAIAEAPHPWLVIEDSAHTFEATAAVLAYFDPLLAPGDHLVVEDGVVADLPEPPYRRYEDGPNRAVRNFLLARHADYRIARDLCDYFGHNVTWCPNGWLVRNG